METRCFYAPACEENQWFHSYSAVKEHYGYAEPCALVVFPVDIYYDRVIPRVCKRPLAVGDRFYRREAPDKDKKELLSRAMILL